MSVIIKADVHTHEKKSVGTAALAFCYSSLTLLAMCTQRGANYRSFSELAK